MRPSFWESVITLPASFSSLQLKRFTNTFLFCLFCLKIINILSLYHCKVTTSLLSLQIQRLTSNSYGERKRRENRFSKRNEICLLERNAGAEQPAHVIVSRFYILNDVSGTELFAALLTWRPWIRTWKSGCSPRSSLSKGHNYCQSLRFPIRIAQQTKLRSPQFRGL